MRGCGVGLRAPHQVRIAAERPAIAWLEAHSENYFARGGAQLELLAAIRESYALSLMKFVWADGAADLLTPFIWRMDCFGRPHLEQTPWAPKMPSDKSSHPR